jgi:hypothetical protein
MNAVAREPQTASAKGVKQKKKKKEQELEMFAVGEHKRF